MGTHPSGSLEPPSADGQVACQFEAVAEALSIPVVNPQHGESTTGTASHAGHSARDNG